MSHPDAGKQKVLDRDDNPMLVAGCKCTDVCKGKKQKMTDCLCYVARQRGPIQLGECKCAPGGRTYHDKTGLCFRCEGMGTVDVGAYVEPHVCQACKSTGFEKSAMDGRCTFCDGTEGGHPPGPTEIETWNKEHPDATA